MFNWLKFFRRKRESIKEAITIVLSEEEEERKELKENVKYFTFQIRNNPCAATYNNRGVIYAQDGLFNRALLDYEMAMTLDPNDAVSYHNRGKVYERLNNLELALQDFNKAIDLKPIAGFYTSRAEFLEKIGREEEAQKDYEMARAVIKHK